MIVHLLDIEWLLSTLFDASLFNFRAAGNGGSFFCLVPFRVNRASGRQRKAPATANVRRPCSKPCPAGNYVCTFALLALDMTTTPEQFCHSEWRTKFKDILFSSSVAWGV